MLEIIYETDVYIGILLSESPFIQKSRIQVLENVNWRKFWIGGYQQIGKLPTTLAVL